VQTGNAVRADYGAPSFTGSGIAARRETEQALEARAQAAQEAERARTAQTREPEAPRSPVPVIAVRTGPAPPPSLLPDPSVPMRQAMAERAVLRSIAAVLTQVESEEPAVPELVLPGSGARTEHGQRAGALAGEGRREDAQELRLPGARPRADHPAPPAATPPRRPVPVRDAAGQEEVSHGDDGAVLERAGGLAPQPAAVAAQESGRREQAARLDLPGADDQPAGERIAHRTLSHAGPLEAHAEQAIVSRTVDGSPGESPNATSLAREAIRSRAISTYA
jgi:hypothetical protein